MVRYHGQQAEKSDDYANDQYAAELRKKAGIQCSNCVEYACNASWCYAHVLKVQPNSWCSRFERKKPNVP